MFSRDAGHFRGVTQVVNAHNKHMGETYMSGSGDKTQVRSRRDCAQSDRQAKACRAPSQTFGLSRVS